ncbi:uncharacterized protein [Spinacia oleracea]|uniref:Uncharacterized protein n=1 Tax=Spinacia oleracea TaxID=3562 RepID=A0ABM3R752_SPIOL|nr:uncharacterized protein LOC110795897 [Spinacia oleracea]
MLLPPATSPRFKIFCCNNVISSIAFSLNKISQNFIFQRSLNSFSPSIWPSNSAVELSRRRTQQSSNSGVARPCVAVFAGGSVFSPHLPHRVLFSPSQSQVFRSLTLSCANLFEEPEQLDGQPRLRQQPLELTLIQRLGLVVGIFSRARSLLCFSRSMKCGKLSRSILQECALW